MAKGIIEVSGMEDVIGDLDRIIDDIPLEAKKALTSSFIKIESAMKSNAVSMFDKGYSKGRMVDSIGYHVGENYDGVITGSVGVYWDGVKDPKRRIPSPVLALMYEAGIKPHSTAAGSKLAHKSGVKEKYQQTGKKGILHGGSPVIPFMSSAFYANFEGIFIELKENLIKSADGK